MTKKRPYATEGHLHLPQGLRPPGPADRRRPFAEDGDTWTAQVRGEPPTGAGVRAGDRVVLIRRRRPEHGDLVAVAEPIAGTCDESAVRLWRARPEAEALRLTGGGHTLVLPPTAKVSGVVVAVLRALR